MINESLLTEVRNRFAHVDHCPYQGKRIFFENAGGALTLKSVTEASDTLAAIPDNQGRDNPASKKLVDIISTAKEDIQTFFGSQAGTVFVGESGTELLFRLVRTAIVGTQSTGRAPEDLQVAAGGRIVGSTLEHPATASACDYWSSTMGREFVRVPHNNETGTVTAEDYLPYLTPDTCVATILHTSPVTGMSTDVAAIAKTIRTVSPSCFIIVDGIQHAAHGGLDLAAYNIDGYVVSAYKVFSRHGYGVAWVSDRMNALPHERLNGTPGEQWELGTRDTGAYATFSKVVDYFDWLGSQFTNATDRRTRILAAGKEISLHEKSLAQAMLSGTDGQRGLADMPGVTIIGGVDNDSREGLVALTVDGVPSVDVVSHLSADGIRVHVRKDDHYSGNILIPLNLDSCVRVSMCHYNTKTEVARFLQSMEKLVMRN